MARFCCEPGCNGVAQEGRFCPTHVSDNYVRRSEKSRKNQETYGWYDLQCWRNKKYGLRISKLMEDPACEETNADGTICLREATDVHHIDGSWREGGVGAWEKFMDRNNLQSLCHIHHSAKTAKEHLNNQ